MKSKQELSLAICEMLDGVPLSDAEQILLVVSTTIKSCAVVKTKDSKDENEA